MIIFLSYKNHIISKSSAEYVEIKNKTTWFNAAPIWKRVSSISQHNISPNCKYRLIHVQLRIVKAQADLKNRS